MENPPAKPSTTLPATSSVKSSPPELARKVVALTKLHSHFYQPGQTEAQVRGVIEDMLEDLARFSAYAVEDACGAYRRNAANRFFPTPGQLIDAAKGAGDSPPRRMPAYDPNEFQARGAFSGPHKPVGQILREHGFERAASKWEAREES